ncbi:MAG: hypothetical protein COA50_08130 [Flavobacteriaceae bacterium]|nr:MAG: hypothetical protein COA50_08130 [Flavobacteriaceae bacterium]
MNLGFSALSGVGGIDQPKLSAIEIFGNNNSNLPSTAKTSATNTLINEDYGIETFNDSLENLDVEIQISPNPIVFEASIKLKGPAINIVEINLYDITGRLIRKYDPNKLRLSDGLYKFNVLGLEEGIYIMNILTGNHKVYDYKLIIKK